MALFSLDQLGVPIVQAPMAGGPSTPALAAAVASAGALGFLAAGYRTVDAVRADLADFRERAGDAPVGVNLFAPPGHGAGAGELGRYADRLSADAARLGADTGTPRWDDDQYAGKLDLLRGERPAVVSFTFGCPSREDVDGLHAAGIAAWVTVTAPDEARQAAAAGADALVVQGVEAGGHRGGFDDAVPGEFGLLALLQLVRRETDLPLVATGAVMTGAAVAAVLAAGATAAQVGTAFLRCPEAATSPPHRAALSAGSAPTALTRAFTGRAARGIVNRFMTEHGSAAPSAYPEVHHLTAPLRAAARARGDAESINLWAGQAYPLAEQVGAAELVRRLAEDARASLQAASARLA